jgi:hypothetical protein
MSYEQPLMKVGLFAADDDRSNLATNQYFGVNIGTAQNITGAGQGNAAIVKTTVANSTFIGVLQNNPIQGESCELISKGITKARATGSFAVGANLKTDSSGGFVSAGSGDTVVAFALEQAVAGDITSIFLK